MNPRINSLLMFVYSADGEKLRTVHYTAAPNITVAAGQRHELSKDEILSVDSTDYIGSLVVRNGKPDMYTFTGGYYAFAGTYPSLGTVGGLYFYNYDHLGNVREVVNEDGKLLQVNWYKEVADCTIREIKSARDCIKAKEEEVLNYFINRHTNASAESFNSKIKGFKAQLHGVADIPFFMYRLCTIFG